MKYVWYMLTFLGGWQIRRMHGVHIQQAGVYKEMPVKTPQHDDTN